MKLFQNPLVVGGLAVAAAALVFWNVIGPMWSRRAAAPAPNVSVALPTPALTPSPAPKPAALPPPPIAKIEPGERIDTNRLGWTGKSAPQRDPFQVVTNEAGQQRVHPSAMDVLSLGAVWRQTGGDFAVINGRVVATGDAIEGFKIEDIEQNLVWVRGPAGRERVDFKTALPGKPASP